MFKCCVCRKTSKKEKTLQQDGKRDDFASSNEAIDGRQLPEPTETKQICRKQNGSAIESPKSLGKINRVDENHDDCQDRKDKPNGDVQKRGEIFTNVVQKDEILSNVKNDQIATNDPKNEGKIQISSTLKLEGQSNGYSDEGLTSGWNEPPKDSIFNGPLSTLKNNLYDATAYIERTIDDGPEDEGDDSVFEACPVEVQVDRIQPTVSIVPRCLSREDDDAEDDTMTVPEDVDTASEIHGGMQEPPATPVARDELALRRHRFFSDLLSATQNSNEHRVRFDPLGPLVHAGCETSDREEHLEELVNRLENVTKRLEKVPTPTVQTQEIAVQTNTPSPKRSAQASENTVTEQQPLGSTLLKAKPIGEDTTSMSVAGYEDILAGSFKEYLKLSEKIGGDVVAHSKLVELAFQNQLQFLKIAANSPAPGTQSSQMSLLAPTSAQIEKIQEFREKHRGSAFFNHLSAISESIPALGWVAISPTPAPYVKEMNDAGQFYTNRVLKEWKEKDKTHVEWCKAWVQTLSDLQQYVRQHHTTGLVWAKTGSVPPPPPPCGVPPPPPSMPLADMAPSVNDDRSALFAQINQGEDITKSLKKVTSEMQTHKNPALRTGPAPFKPQASNSVIHKTVPPANVPIDKPPVFVKDGKKWLVEYQKGKTDLVIDNVEMNNVVYMFRCQDSTLTIKGKLNSIVMDSCRKSSIVFDNLVSSISFVNCQSVQMQVLGYVPTISIDKTDGCQMYLSKESTNAEFISSKSSEMNAMVPKGDGDYVEYAIPEQFKTTFSGKGLTTVAIDAMG